MLKEFLSTADALRRIKDPNGHRYFAIEENRECNRRCPHCKVPELYNREKELTVSESQRVVDRLHAWGFRAGTLLGGEPLAPFVTKEGKTFFQQTLSLIDYATKERGMFIGVSSNGDYFSDEKAEDLERAGLNWITFSLHDETKKGLDRLVECGKIAARHKIVPIIHTLITNKNADYFPGIAAHIVENGLLVNATVVQEKGGSFSIKPEVSLIPSVEQEKMVFDALAHLASYGFVRISKRLLLEGTKHYPNKWKCNPERDYFLHIGAGGTLDVCEEVRTNISILDIENLGDESWRESKRENVEKCTGCLYRCYYESEKPNLWDECGTFLVMNFIRAGGADLAGKWGGIAAKFNRKLAPDIDWSLRLE